MRHIGLWSRAELRATEPIRWPGRVRDRRAVARRAFRAIQTPSQVEDVMRSVTLSIMLLLAISSVSAAGDARTTLGDIPRTYSHYLNAEEAALCRANAATGGLSSYFLNPACVSEVDGIAGHATIRYNIKSRDYLPDGAAALDASDDGLLFSQFVAVKTSGAFTLGFGYSNPSYRNVEITGKIVEDEELKDYKGEFNGSLRFFEGVAAMRIGDRGQGALGVSAGVANLTEESKESIAGASLRTARVDGLAACYAAGFAFDVTDMVTVAVGYRWSSTIDVDGDYYKQSLEGESTTQPVTTAGIRVTPTETLVLHASYVREGWDRAQSSLAAYPEEEGGQDWDPFGEPIATIAVGGELLLAEGKASVSAGYSQELGADIDSSIVPENSIGLGGSIRFDQYVGRLSLVRETFAEGEESGQVTNYGVYASVGYEF